MTDYIAVVDLETTGLFPGKHDRILEIGIVLISIDGRIHKEYESLVNPERDLGPTGIHRIRSAEVMQAPKFMDIAGDVIALLRSARVVAGHNISFDKRFLVDEFWRMDVTLPDFPCFCTYRHLGRGSLKACCDEYNVTFEGEPHAALSDARATARLIHSITQVDPDTANSFNTTETTNWPSIAALGTAPVTRHVARELLSKPPTFLQRIVARGTRDVEATPADTLSYLALLDRVLEDRAISSAEADSLVGMAESLGLSSEDLLAAHSDYLQSLLIHALADGVISEAERSDIQEVAQLLGCDQRSLDAGIDAATKKLTNTQVRPSSVHSSLSGKTVCFTGELQSRINGDRITRELAEVMAGRAGMRISNSVTKKLDLLVVADPNTQSGKAKKARGYGTRILAEPVFWQMVGVEVE